MSSDLKPTIEIALTCHCCPHRRWHLFRRKAESRDPHPCHTTCEHFCFSFSLSPSFPSSLSNGKRNPDIQPRSTTTLTLKPRKTSSRRAAPPRTRRPEGHAPSCLPPLDTLKGFMLINNHEAASSSNAHWLKSPSSFFISPLA